LSRQSHALFSNVATTAATPVRRPSPSAIADGHRRQSSPTAITIGHRRWPWARISVRLPHVSVLGRDGDRCGDGTRGSQVALTGICRCRRISRSTPLCPQASLAPRGTSACSAPPAR
jgi:hypothetical protein